ncbi:MFS transporter [Actinomadura terrae]|uniref:MFS transporter n=1 Tax=Actinomadura terrae TaxID=604353 RepID=UPI001FA73826|nr:MFS transporter [Actinomadura terrae]
MSSDSPHPVQAGPGRRLISLLALTCGVGVAGIYFPQAISPLIADDLGVSQGAAAVVVTAAQFGYAAGVFLLVPLGDRLQHRRLIVTLLAVTGAGLLAAGLAPGLTVLLAASALVGVATVVPQIIIPMTAGLVPERRRGAVTGTLLSGLIGGILLARSFSGGLGQWFGWRAPYLVAAVVVGLLAVVLAFTVPATTPSSADRYPALLATTFRLLRTEPDLRRSGLYQALIFAGFSAAWTSLALLVTGPAYDLGASAVGLIALVGAASMFATPIAGRMTDRYGSDPVGLVCMLGTVAAAALLATGGLGGATGLVGVTLALLLLDVAMQSGQVANQARIFALRPEARSRLNTAYMTCSFLGGSLGSWLGVRAYGVLGWNGVCLLVAVLAVLALVRHLVAMRRGTRRSGVGGAVGAGGLAGGVEGVEERA